MKKRLDTALVERALARSRTAAKALIERGLVEVDGRRVTKPSTPISSSSRIRVEEHREWVSRGALKLEAALDAFDIDVKGRTAVDVGASTGGFTEVLLDRGASSVVALDVGRGQLANRLASDRRVTNLEAVNVKSVSANDLGGCSQIVVADVSFISLTKIAGRLADFACIHGDVVVLVKPQFEVQRADLSKKGIVTSPEKRVESVRSVAAALDSEGIGAREVIRSPIAGGDGNIEYLLWGRKSESSRILEVPI